MGRITRLGVQEGDRVRQGQFLLQIDPVNAEAAVRRDIAAVAGAMTSLEQSKVSLQSGRAQLDNARQNLKRQQELWTAGLTTRETLERTAGRSGNPRERSQGPRAGNQDPRNAAQPDAGGSRQQPAHAAQVRFEAPFDGIVTRRNVEEGENVVIGTMNNAGTVLLTVADMSVIEAEVEVDETDVPFVQMGQIANIEIDAIPDRVFKGHVTEIGNSPIQAAGAGTTRTATNFKVTITIDGQIPEVRPGFTCTAEITTATRKKQVVSVPIQAMTVRELLYDESGNVIHEPRPPRTRIPLRPAGNPGGHAGGAEGAQARPEARRSRRRVRHARRQGVVRHRQDRHCR